MGDLIHPEDLVLLVIPIDKAAPKGRLILPQQQVIRDILEADAVAVCVKEYELRGLLEKLPNDPALVITDSQVFAKVSADVPERVPLTSFSILMARYKGLLDEAVRGVAAIERLKEFPEDLTRFALVIHCGGCMLNEREVRSRMKRASAQGVPITNYGVTIAYMQGILRRCISMFPHLLAELEE